MVRAIERGLSLLDFEHLTIAQIIDYIVAYNKGQSEESVNDSGERLATQSDYDAF